MKNKDSERQHFLSECSKIEKDFQINKSLYKVTTDSNKKFNFIHV